MDQRLHRLVVSALSVTGCRSTVRQDKHVQSKAQGAAVAGMRQLPCYVGAHILMVGRGCALPGLLSARAGAEQVTCIEGSRMLYYMSKQLLLENRDAPNAAGICLLDRSLHAIRVKGGSPVSLAGCQFSYE